MGNQEKATNEAVSETCFSGNACINCIEGHQFDDSVYCNIDGCFHPPYDNLTCKRFKPKKNLKKEVEGK